MSKKVLLPDGWEQYLLDNSACSFEMDIEPISFGDFTIPSALEGFLDPNVCFKYVIIPGSKCNLRGKLEVDTTTLLAYVAELLTSDELQQMIDAALIEAKKVTCFGCTSSFAFGHDLRENTQYFPGYCFLQSLLRRYLSSSFHSIPFRMRKSVTTFNLSRDGAIALLATPSNLTHELSQINERIPLIKEEDKESDSADIVCLLPLKIIVDAIKEMSDVATVMEKIKNYFKEMHLLLNQNKDWVIEHHLRLFVCIIFSIFRESCSSLSQFKELCNVQDMSVVVFIKSYEDATNIDLPGGKRDLGETQWRAVVRETSEEIFLDITNTMTSPLSRRDSSIFSDSVDHDVEWIGYLHHSFLYVSLHHEAYMKTLSGKHVVVPDTDMFDKLFKESEVFCNHYKSEYSKIRRRNRFGGELKGEKHPEESKRASSREWSNKVTAGPSERPKLILQPRSLPLDSSTTLSTAQSKSSSIFGEGKPRSKI